MDTHRGTGRTTRMVDQAIRLGREGRAVYVVTADAREQNRIRQLVLERSGGELLGIQVETPESMSLNWETVVGVRGMWPNCVVLVDHFAIESRFRRLLDMLHAFDVVPPKE